MPQKPINEVLAENLRHFMAERQLKQPGLSAKSRVAQTTISLYLRPEARKESASGKTPSAKLSEVEQLAEALGVEVWELLRPLTPEARAAYAQIEAAFLVLNAKQQPDRPSREWSQTAEQIDAATSRSRLGGGRHQRESHLNKKAA